MKILHVVGARPNFMKTAPLFAAMSREPQVFEQFLVHTGQHYDFAMSGVFFSDLACLLPTSVWESAAAITRSRPRPSWSVLIAV
jgi:UDP-N-acetylglucosamine 2-epimerase